MFPIVGRVDYRANWVPAHFLRYLLSTVGRELFLVLGLDCGEVWRLRELARTFRYGVASAYEKALGAGELQRRAGAARFSELPEVQLARSLALPGQDGGPEEVPEEEELDLVRHVFPEAWQGPALQDLQVFRSEDSDGSESLEESTTTSFASGSSSSGLAPQEQEEEEEEAGPPSSSMPPVQPGVGVPVGYRPEDGALIVLHEGEELRIDLPGWTLEEVSGVVRSIETGDWGHFQVMMALAGEQGLSARGRVQGISYDTCSVPEARGGQEVDPTMTDVCSEEGEQSGE